MATLRNLLLGFFELQQHRGKTKSQTFPGWRQKADQPAKNPTPYPKIYEHRITSRRRWPPAVRPNVGDYAHDGRLADEKSIRRREPSSPARRLRSKALTQGA